MQVHAMLIVAACVGVSSLSASAQELCFEATPYAVGSEPSDVVLADFSGDGFLDMAVSNHDPKLDNRVSILVNNGDGTFAPSVFYEVGDRPYWMATGDLNGDGWTDLVVTNYFGVSVSVLINEGAGVFAPHVDYSTGVGPTFVALGKIDANDSLDLVVANGLESSVSLLFNNGDGTFARQIPYEVGYLPYGVTAADLNNDGYCDVATADYGTGDVNTEISVLLNNGDGTLAPRVVYLAGPAAVGIAAVDLDNDSFVELIAANDGFLAQANTISVLKNNGDGTFAPQVEYVVGTGPYGVATADFNADGFADVTTANEEGSVSILMNNGDGTFGAASTTPVGSLALGVTTGDLDGNGTPEIAATSYYSNEVWVLFNKHVGLLLQPADTEVAVGDMATFNVSASGPEPLTYQWRRDGVELSDGGAVSGATTDTLAINPVAARDAGTYDVVITNDCGSLVSAAATLTITTITCTADLNRDGIVGGADLGILLGGWGQGGIGDLDGNGSINGADLGTLLGSWGPC